jgi:hypothetical protein
MATAVGIAADLDSVDINAPVADYLGTGWTVCSATEADIRVVHQLTMTTGLTYTGLNFFCTDPECLVCLADPGERWNYHNGQLLNIAPEEGLVMVRMGDSPQDGDEVPAAYNDSIWTYLNAMTATTATNGPVANDDNLSVFPNPAREEVSINTVAGLSRVTVFSGKGRRLQSQRISGNSGNVSLLGLPSGVLYLRIMLLDGTVLWRRVVKV